MGLIDGGLDDLAGGGGNGGGAAAGNDRRRRRRRGGVDWSALEARSSRRASATEAAGAQAASIAAGLGASLVNDVWRDELIPQWASRRADADVRARVLAGEPPAALQGCSGTRRSTARRWRRTTRRTERWWRGWGSCASRSSGTCSGSSEQNKQLCADLDVIEADVPRTFCADGDGDGGELRGTSAEELTALLQALLLADSDGAAAAGGYLGYVQGISYAAAFVLGRAPPWQSYGCLRALCVRPALRRVLALDPDAWEASARPSSGCSARSSRDARDAAPPRHHGPDVAPRVARAAVEPHAAARPRRPRLAPAPPRRRRCPRPARRSRRSPRSRPPSAGAATLPTAAARSRKRRSPSAATSLSPPSTARAPTTPTSRSPPVSAFSVSTRVYVYSKLLRVLGVALEHDQQLAAVVLDERADDLGEHRLPLRRRRPYTSSSASRRRSSGVAAVESTSPSSSTLASDDNSAAWPAIGCVVSDGRSSRRSSANALTRSSFGTVPSTARRRPCSSFGRAPTRRRARSARLPLGAPAARSPAASARSSAGSWPPHADDAVQRVGAESAADAADQPHALGARQRAERRREQRAPLVGRRLGDQPLEHGGALARRLGDEAADELGARRRRQAFDARDSSDSRSVALSPAAAVLWSSALAPQPLELVRLARQPRAQNRLAVRELRSYCLQQLAALGAVDVHLAHRLVERRVEGGGVGGVAPARRARRLQRERRVDRVVARRRHGVGRRRLRAARRGWCAR